MYLNKSTIKVLKIPQAIQLLRYVQANAYDYGRFTKVHYGTKIPLKLLSKLKS